jgi:hypothetical protein
MINEKNGMVQERPVTPKKLVKIFSETVREK